MQRSFFFGIFIAILKYDPCFIFVAVEFYTTTYRIVMCYGRVLLQNCLIWYILIYIAHNTVAVTVKIWAHKRIPIWPRVRGMECKSWVSWTKLSITVYFLQMLAISIKTVIRGPHWLSTTDYSNRFYLQYRSQGHNVMSSMAIPLKPAWEKRVPVILTVNMPSGSSMNIRLKNLTPDKYVTRSPADVFLNSAATTYKD